MTAAAKVIIKQTAPLSTHKVSDWTDHAPEWAEGGEIRIVAEEEVDPRTNVAHGIYAAEVWRDGRKVGVMEDDGCDAQWYEGENLEVLDSDAFVAGDGQFGDPQARPHSVRFADQKWQEEYDRLSDEEVARREAERAAREKAENEQYAAAGC